MRRRADRWVTVAILLAGCGAGGTAPSPGVTVVARAVYTRRPVADARIAVRARGGDWIERRTGADGRARFASVERPYDLLVLPGDGDADLFLGVERGDPEVVVPETPGPHSATVEATFSAACDPCPAFLNGFVTVVAPQAYGWRSFFTPADAVTLPVDWMGGDNLTAADVHALQWTWTGSPPGSPEYWHAAQVATVDAGGTLTLPPATMEPAATSMLQIQTSGLPGWEVQVDFGFDPSPRKSPGWTWLASNSDLADLSLAVPDHSAFRADVTLYSGDYRHGAWQRGVRGGGPPVQLVLRDAPELLSPAPDSGALSGTFSWTPVAGMPSILAFSSTGSYVTVSTAASTGTYPDLTAFGIPPPSSGASVSWSVAAKGPAASVDDLLAPDALQSAGWAAYALDRGFTVE